MGIFFSSQVDVSDVFVDFHGADPKGDEKEMFDVVTEILIEGKSMLDHLDQYADCGLSIRRALTNPTPDNEREAFAAVKANVDIINGFYQFSKKIGKPQLLHGFGSAEFLCFFQNDISLRCLDLWQQMMRKRRSVQNRQCPRKLQMFLISS
jgi:hypothetical protein